VTTLAIDLGGTKILAALVQGGRVLDRAQALTARGAGPAHWVEQMADLVRNWSGRYARAGLCVTGLVAGGRWSALNRRTLDLPGAFPLARVAADRLGLPVTLANDGQAAAFGEYRHGAGVGRDMVFLTVSTGIGGGIVSGGRLVTGRGGLAGNVGQFVALPDGDAAPFEDAASGAYLAASAGDARAAFAANHPAVGQSAARLARLCRNLQLLVDPQVIVLGGGVGLAPGYLARVAAELSHLPDVLRPDLVPAALGDEAGVIGVAALAEDNDNPTERGSTT
jgi:predicted NBD/HSP70 family sugar kinase